MHAIITCWLSSLSLQLVNLTGMMYRDDDEDFTEETNMDRVLRMRDETPIIYICATMWHETETEMIQMLKSICK